MKRDPIVFYFQVSILSVRLSVNSYYKYFNVLMKKRGTEKLKSRNTGNEAVIEI
jgi:hypothetical protein